MPAAQEEKNNERYRIGIDLGGTKTDAILLDPAGAELWRQRRPTPVDAGYDAVVENVAGLIKAADGQVPPGRAATVGVGIPGSLDGPSGRVRNANTTLLNGRPLADDIAGRLGRAVVLENDANCFTLAEARAGAGRDADLVFGVIMGTGCGGGIAWGGRVRGGPHGIAGEWGHVSIDPEGPECYCGNRGCVETLISGSGVQNRYRNAWRAAGSPSTGAESPASSGAPALIMEEIVRLARAGDSLCAGVFERFLDDFGRALGGLISILDPDLVVLGGGLSHIDELYDRGLERVRHHAFHENLRTPVVRNELGDSAGVIGAAWLGADS